MVNRRQLMFGAAAMGLTGSLAFRAYAQSAAAGEGTLTFGTLGLLAGLDPHVAASSVWRKTTTMIYDRLLGYDTTGKLQGELAESWEFSDPTTFVVKLKPGVTFHKGQRFSAADVVYTFSRIQDPAVGATLAKPLEGVEVESRDDATVVFKLPQPDVSFPSLLASEEVAIVSAEWMAGSPNVSVEANGTGPFMLESFDPKVQTVVKRNPDFYDGPAKLESIIFRSIADDSARINALKTGSVDLIDTVPWNQIDGLKNAPGLTVFSAPAAFMSLWCNVSRPVMADPRVRRAIAYAIDRNAVSTAAFFGYGAPLGGLPMPETSPFHNPESAEIFNYDPEKARALLKEAGAEGLEIEFLVSQAPAVYVVVGQIVAANLAAVGIKANIQLVDFPTVVERKNSGNYDLVIYGTNIRGPDPNLAYSYFFEPGTGFWANGAKFQDPKVSDLLARGRSELDSEKRKEVYKELELYLLEISPWIFITWRDDAMAYKSSLQGMAHLEGALNVVSVSISAPHLFWS
ncbi:MULTISPECIES: ABC transporter substrate-binding protein [Chelativorans]|jgi:ABC-type transport system substrate-binding protein|uniref:Twin-arginine translocation pathway signal n=1 Tax=Chelativorans sp. (strain BNC1) TaxID=266779 RepID=Q11FR4_CHESB|nr:MULTISPECIES: ABC transporter substrate-binding protein [Chelativorans]